MKSKASTTTSSSNTTRKDFRLVAHPNLSLILRYVNQTQEVLGMKALRFQSFVFSSVKSFGGCIVDKMYCRNPSRSCG